LRENNLLFALYLVGFFNFQVKRFETFYGKFIKIFLMPGRFQTLIVSLTLVSSAGAQMPARIATSIDNIEKNCIEWRRHFHQFPELANDEHKTATYIANYLRGLGLDVKEGIAKTGVVAILRGAKPGPCIALRADMDALPVTERTKLSFASKETTIYAGKETGVMHACGHDAHMAMLMSVAAVLSSDKEALKGSIKFIFQPAEEGPPEGQEGGAPLMIKEGVMEDPHVDVIFGLHIQSGVPLGTIQYKAGAFMAAADFFSIKVTGKASHGSQPWLGTDPITTAAQIINGLQLIVSRESDLTKAPVVITVGKIDAGTRNNIIPEECNMLGTIRTLDSSMRLKVLDKVRASVNAIAEACGAKATVNIEERTLVTYNEPALLKKMLPSLFKAIGEVNVKEREWVTGGEDFSYFGTKAPSLFLYLGAMPPNTDARAAPPHHTPDFYIDERGMKNGIKVFCQLVLDYMNFKN
jgi:amidohydrolase